MKTTKRNARVIHANGHSYIITDDEIHAGTYLLIETDGTFKVREYRGRSSYLKNRKANLIIASSDETLNVVFINKGIEFEAYIASKNLMPKILDRYDNQKDTGFNLTKRQISDIENLVKREIEACITHRQSKYLCCRKEQLRDAVTKAFFNTSCEMLGHSKTANSRE